MKNIFKLLASIIVLLFGITIIYIIAKDTFKRSDLIFKDGIKYYNEQNYDFAEQCLQSEAKHGNEDAYPYLGHTKLILNKPKEAEKYLLLALENLNNSDDIEIKKNVLFNLGCAYINLKEESKAKKYLLESLKLGNKEAEKILLKYNMK